jgi:hypothetical protein
MDIRKPYKTSPKFFPRALRRKIDLWQNSKCVKAKLQELRQYRVHVKTVGDAKGAGLFASVPIPAGKNVGVYRGTIIHKLTHVKEHMGDYFQEFPYIKGFPGSILDGETHLQVDDNLAFVNHSCQGYNCVMKEIPIGHCSLLTLHTMRDIDADEELLIHYDHHVNDDTPQTSLYWKLEEEHGPPCAPPNAVVQRCACAWPQPCPFLRYRLVYH